jgi:hypothetical protein
MVFWVFSFGNSPDFIFQGLQAHGVFLWGQEAPRFCVFSMESKASEGNCFAFDGIGKAGDTEPAASLQVFNVNCTRTMNHTQGAWAISGRYYRRGKGGFIVAMNRRMDGGRHGVILWGRYGLPVLCVFLGFSMESKGKGKSNPPEAPRLQRGNRGRGAGKESGGIV